MSKENSNVFDKTFLAFLKFQVKGIFDSQINIFDFVKLQSPSPSQPQPSNFKN